MPSSRILGLAALFMLGACPNPDKTKLPEVPLPTATPLPEPLVALLPESQIRDVVATPSATWVATSGPLFRFDKKGGPPERFGPKEGLEYGEAIKLVSEGDTVAIAGRRGVYLYKEGVLRKVPPPNDPLLSGYQATDLALFNGELFGSFGPQLSTMPLLCEEKPGSEIALSKVFKLTAKGAEPLVTPAPPQAIAASPEGFWVASQNKLYVLENGFSQFREMALDQGADISQLEVDPKGRLWAITDQGLFGGTAKNGIEAIEGGEFFAGPREALDLGFVEGYVWIATQRGAYRSDGKTWQRFEISPEAGVTLTSLAAEKDTLYIGSDRGLISGKPGEWKLLLSESSAPPGAVRAITRAIGKILLGTASEPGFELSAGGLQTAIQDKETENLLGEANPLNLKGQPKLSRPGREGKGLSPKTAESQVIGVSFAKMPKVGLFAIGQDGKLFSMDDGGLSSGVLALQQARDGTLWIAGRRGIRQLRIDGSLEAPPALTMIGARSMAVDKKGSIWFAATDAPTGRGLGLYGRVLASWLTLTMNEKMPSNEIYAVASQENYIYVAQPKGITQIKISDQSINTVRLPSTIFQLEASSKDLWAAGCEQVFHREAEDWINYPNLPNGVAIAMVTDSKGRLFAGNRSGLYQFKEGRWVYLPGAGGSGVSALAIVADAEEKESLWIGAESGAVFALPMPE